MVTLDDVAARAGVSRTTASRAMNGISSVHPDRVAAVRSAAEALGFRPNPAARSLARGRSDSIALVVPEWDLAGEEPNTFFSPVLRGAIQEVTNSDLQLVMLLRTSGQSDEKFLRSLDSSRVDGALVVLESHNLDLPQLLAGRDLPVVYLGRPLESESLAVSYVDVDNVGGSSAAAHALIAAGRRRIGVIAGPAEMGVTIDRLSGWSKVMNEHGLDTDLVAYADFQIAGGEQAMQELLRRAPALDGVFVMSDLMAAGALAALRSHQRSVPDDISLVAFDDTVIATSVEPKLTTVRQPLAALGGLMVSTLVQLIADPSHEPIRVTLPVTMVERESV